MNQTTHLFRAIDTKTIEEIQALYSEAERTGQTVDWETATVVPRKYKGMDPHQRDLMAAQDTRRQQYKDLSNQKDNDPASPEEAGW